MYPNSSVLTVFSFESNEIRFVGTADNPEWIAADVCKALGLEGTSKALVGFKENEAGTINVRTRSESGAEQDRQMLTVYEPGLYRLIFN